MENSKGTSNTFSSATKLVEQNFSLHKMQQKYFVFFPCNTWPCQAEQLKDGSNTVFRWRGYVPPCQPQAQVCTPVGTVDKTLQSLLKPPLKALYDRLSRPCVVNGLWQPLLALKYLGQGTILHKVRKLHFDSIRDRLAHVFPAQGCSWHRTLSAEVQEEAYIQGRDAHALNPRDESP